MQIKFCIYGDQFDPIDFLSKASNIAETYILWDDKNLFDSDEGVTLNFSCDDDSAKSIAAIKKFILSNKGLLESYSEKKEISITFNSNILKKDKFPTGIYNVSSQILKIMANSNIECFISFED